MHVSAPHTFVGGFPENLLCSAVLAFLGVIGTYEYGLGRGLCLTMGGPHMLCLYMVCGGVLRGAVEPTHCLTLFPSLQRDSPIMSH